MVDLDKWIEKVKRCEYLAEDELKALCEYVRSQGCSRRSVACIPRMSCAAAAQFTSSLPRVSSSWGTLGRQTIPQVKEILVEESNVQPVQAPVTV
jgi:hypothetical protein